MASIVGRSVEKDLWGLTRNEIIETCKLTSGGHTTQLLEELTESGFIDSYIPFKKNKYDALYKLVDEYSLFYLRFMEGRKSMGAGTWVRFTSGNSWTVWSGYAFESMCMKHLPQIKKALGIGDVYTEVSSWRHRPVDTSDQGAQIDLLIDRNDSCINVCEMKFSANEFVINKAYARELENKLLIFREQTKTKKTLFLTMITTFGVKNSRSFPGLVQKEATMPMFFAE